MHRKFFCFLATFSVSWKFLQIFHVFFLSKISVRIFRNLHQKNLHRKFSVLQKKFDVSKFSGFLQNKFSDLKIVLIRLNPCLFKKWCDSIWCALNLKWVAGLQFHWLRYKPGRIIWLKKLFKHIWYSFGYSVPKSGSVR